MKFRYHVLICTEPCSANLPGGKCTRTWDSEASFQELVQLIRQNHLEHAIKLSRTDCFGLCCHGPIVVVYPDDVWYCKAYANSNIHKIFNQHLLRGQVVHDLLVPEWVFPDAPDGTDVERNKANQF